MDLFPKGFMYGLLKIPFKEIYHCILSTFSTLPQINIYTCAVMIFILHLKIKKTSWKLSWGNLTFSYSWITYRMQYIKMILFDIFVYKFSCSYYIYIFGMVVKVLDLCDAHTNDDIPRKLKYFHIL